jgi:DUF2075 family protein
MSQATRNEIADRLRESFIHHFRYKPPQSEVSSWRNSLSRIATAIGLAGLTDHGVACEYQLPLTSRRLDVMVTGHNDDVRPMASIVELKQWDGAAPSDVKELVTVYLGGRPRETLHPSVQVGQYRQYLADTHEAFSDGRVGLRAASYLHNFMHDSESELYAPRHAGALALNPLFAGDEIDDLASWMRTELSGGNGILILESVLNGKYKPNKKLLSHTARMIKGHPAYILLDEQKVAFNSVLAGVAEAHASGKKSVVLIKGGPGTGKSVLAVNLVAELGNAGYVTHHATGSRAFTTNLRKAVGTKAAALFKYFNSYAGDNPDVIDVLILDEAHRLRVSSANQYTPVASRSNRPQVDELIDAARVTVFFIDDLQVVRPGEIGSSELIRQAASRAGAQLKDFELEAQFRCAGSETFVSWVENTLGLKRTPDIIWESDQEFDLDIVESPEELGALIEHKNDQGNTARLVAGFCWPWSNPAADGSLIDDVKVGGFSRPWNARPGSRVAKGIPKADLWATDAEGIRQVGCVYTAQGFEFDYVGVIVGRDLVYRPKEGWIGQPEFSRDSVVKKSAKDLARFTELVKQTYRVLLTRGLKGCYVYFQDEQTRDFITSRIERGMFEAVSKSMLPDR